jgi:hypothetical protein
MPVMPERVRVDEHRSDHLSYTLVICISVTISRQIPHYGCIALDYHFMT